MSEFSNQQRTDKLDLQGSTADMAIAGILDNFQAGLTNGHLKGFRDLDDVSEKVKIACCMYAGNPETRSEAVNLRSWHIVRLLMRQYENIEPGNEWEYVICGLSAADDFDRQVFPTAEALLRETVSSELKVTPQTDMISYDHEKNVREQLIMTNDNKAILMRELCYRGTEEAHTASFVVKAI